MQSTELSDSKKAIADHGEKMSWWRDARFGLFIHFGLFSIPAGEWDGHEIGSYSEWIMNKAEISVSDYAQLAARFNPLHFDAVAIAELAKAAGMRYVVLTAKHHEGFALFKSKASPFNSVDGSPCGRDFVRELALACSSHGLRFGVYYSHSQDWHHRGGAGNYWDVSQHGDYDAYLDTVAVPQIRELLTNYGEISVLWYDTPRFITPERAARFEAVHELQPRLIVNNRLLSFDTQATTTRGDTETPENFIPANGYPGRDWESCMTFNDNWGFRKGDTNWKGVPTLLRNLSDIASKGGNFLLNIGLQGDGSVPRANIESLEAIGHWIQRNGVAIYGTQAGPFNRRMGWGRVTRRLHEDGSTTLYLHVWHWPEDGILSLPGLRTKPTSASLLVDNRQVSFHETKEGIDVVLPREPADELITIVVMEIRAPLLVDPPRAQLDAQGRIVLSPHDAELFGPDDAKPVIDGTDEKATIRNLNRSGEWRIVFNFQVPTEGLWQVSAELAIGSYHRMTISSLGPHGTSITSAFNATGEDMDSFSLKELGVIRMHSGLQALEFSSAMSDIRPLLVRRFILTPIAIDHSAS